MNEQVYSWQADKHEDENFYKLMVSLWVWVKSIPKVPKITNLQYLKENVKDEVIFLPEDQYLRSLQRDTIILSHQACP